MTRSFPRGALGGRLSVITAGRLDAYLEAAEAMIPAHTAATTTAIAWDPWEARNIRIGAIPA